MSGINDDGSGEMFDESRNNNDDDQMSPAVGDESSLYMANDGDEFTMGGGEPTGMILEQERFLPIGIDIIYLMMKLFVANVARIMKRRIPSAGKVAKDAKECVQECVSEFISFITSEASDRCLQEKRKTINGEDLLTAMQSLGFDAYIEPLSIYIKQYREATRADKDTLPSGQSTTDNDESTTTNTVGSVVLLDGADANVDSDAAYRLLQRHATATTIFVDSNGQHYISLPTDNGTINLMAVHIPTDVANAAAASSSNQPIN